MSEIHNIAVVLKCDGERQRVVVSGILSAHRVLVVANVTTCADPSLACALSLHLRVDQWSHTVIVQTVGLHQIDDVEPILLAGTSVCYSEVVPLSVASCVVIWLQNQVVLMLVHLDSSSQVRRFEPRLKEQCVILRRSWNVKWWHLTRLSCIDRSRPCVGRCIYSIVDHSVKEVLLVDDSLSFASQTFLKYELLRRI